MNNEMKEVNRQCKMAHSRGRELGRWEGFIFSGFWVAVMTVVNLLIN